MPKNVREIPITGPLMKAGVLDVPTGPDDPQRQRAADLARALPGHGEAPGVLLLIRFGDHGADRADFSFEGIERIDVIGVPKLHLLFALLILAALARPLHLPELEGFFERFLVFLLQHQEGSVAKLGNLGHHRSNGIESVGDDGVDESSVSLVQPLDQAPPRCPFWTSLNWTVSATRSTT